MRTILRNREGYLWRAINKIPTFTGLGEVTDRSDITAKYIRKGNMIVHV